MIVSPYVIADQEHLIFRDGVVPGENDHQARFHFADTDQRVGDHAVCR
ncbi:MAG: hypothetical protein IPK98_06745 [Chloracidobacterium sp.]|nr:hypothetical protein [Chloracidobacterium sp.]